MRSCYGSLLPNTLRENARLIRFPGEDNGILGQYAEAFTKVCG